MAESAVVGILKALLVADTTSFDAGMRKAAGVSQSVEKSLGGLDNAVKKLTPQADRMVKAFSGDKLKYSALSMAAAVERIGGASKLSEAEQRRVNATMVQAIEKYRVFGQTAPQALIDVEQATRRLEPQTSAANKAVGLLKSSFAQFTAATLAANAIQAVTTKVGEFVATGMKLPAVEASFMSLAKAAGQSSRDMLTSMQAATKGLVSDYDLMLGANKALLLGLPVTAESMGELAKTARVLGRAMGQDATTSLDDLITALGRSSPLILDNLGLTVKLGEASDIYAAKLGKTASQLTDAERKMAFYEAAMEAARKKTAELGDQTKTLGEIVQTVWTNIGNVISRATAEINIGLGRALSSAKNFAQFLTDISQFGIATALALQRTRAEAEKLSRATDIDLDKAEAAAKARQAAAFAVKKTNEEAVKLLTTQERMNGLAFTYAKYLESWAPAIENANVSAQDLINFTEHLGDLSKATPAWIDSENISEQVSQIEPELSRLAEMVGRDVDSMTLDVSDGFAQMLVHARGFKDGFLDIWRSIQRGIANILGDILDNTFGNFLRGMIGKFAGAAFGGSAGSLFGTGGNVAMSAAGGAFLGGGAGAGAAMTVDTLPGAAAGGGAAGGFLTNPAFWTNPYTIGAAAGAAALTWAIAKKGLFRGGWEGIEGNERRDNYFAQMVARFGGTPYAAMVKAYTRARVPGNVADQQISAMYRADSEREWESAEGASLNTLTAGGLRGLKMFNFGGFVPPGVVQPAILHGGAYGEDVVPRGRQSAVGQRSVNIYQTFNARIEGMLSADTAEEFRRKVWMPLEQRARFLNTDFINQHLPLEPAR